MIRQLVRPVRVKAFAKINITLRVLGVRADGYHELRTTFQSLALHDTLTFAPAKVFAIDCDDPACPADATNLVWRAAEEMWRAAGQRRVLPGMRVGITKRVPMQAGLGGGSSDAASALRVFARLWNVGDDRLREVAARLGADVPFFLEGGTALGVDRGDLLFPLADWPPQWVALVRPDFGVSTKDAYGWFDGAAADAFSGGGKSGHGRRGADARMFPEMWNDLEPPVTKRHPEIGRLVRRLETLGASYAAMSGSGSAVFGLFAARNIATAAARALSGPRRLTLVTRTLTRAAFAAGSRIR